MAKILLLEDDPLLGETLEELLTNDGHDVRWATDGEAAAEAAYAEEFDLYLLDINVPLLDGFDLLEALRNAGDGTPAIFITALHDIASMTRGFEAGASDYLKKPFDPDELRLRIRARLNTASGNVLRYGPIAYDPHTGTVTRDGKSVEPGPIRTEILRLLIENVGRTIDKSVLLDLLGHPSDQALRFHISKLSQQLGISITNIRGVGYRLEVL